VGEDVRRGLEASHHPRRPELGGRAADRGWIRGGFAAFRCSACKSRKWRRKIWPLTVWDIETDDVAQA
jgi:hypothetical protein